MRRLTYLFSSILVTAMAVMTLATPLVLAVDVIDKVCTAPTSTGTAPEICRDNNTNNADTDNPIYGENGVVTRGVRIFLVIFGVTAIFVLLINAVRMITSMGDAGSFESARNGVIYAAIGLAVAASAQFLVSFIVSKV